MRFTEISLRQKVEWMVRIVLGIGFAIAAGAYFRSGYTALAAIDFADADPTQFGQAFLPFVIGFYTVLIAALYAVRLAPVSKFPGLLPTAAALLGGFLMAAFLLLEPRHDFPIWAQLASCALVLFGNGLAAYVLTHLGKSFSILPESRKLVTRGPYSIVRHPLYFAEAIASFGVAIIFFSWPAAVILVTQISWQLVRMHYEEKVLKESFPEYETYAMRTKRLIPFVY